MNLPFGDFHSTSKNTQGKPKKHNSSQNAPQGEPMLSACKAASLVADCPGLISYACDAAAVLFFWWSLLQKRLCAYCDSDRYVYTRLVATRYLTLHVLCVRACVCAHGTRMYRRKTPTTPKHTAVSTHLARADLPTEQATHKRFSAQRRGAPLPQTPK